MCFFFLSFFFLFFWALSVILGTSPGPAETISCPAKAAHFSLWNISYFTFPTFLLQETVWKHNGFVNELLRIWKGNDMRSYSMPGTGCWDSLWLAAEAHMFVTISVYLHACMKERRIGKRGGKWERQQGGTREKVAGEGREEKKVSFWVLSFTQK